MPQKKVPCPQCGQPKSLKAELCRKCKPTYIRTPESRQRLSDSLQGKPKPGAQGKKRPEHSRMMKAWWTPERRAAMSERQLGLNPAARYHGLSARAAASLVKRIGRCEQCGHDGSESHLGVHHVNRNKHDQSIENLLVLCHQCHMQDHASKGEDGWSRYHERRKTSQD